MSQLNFDQRGRKFAAQGDHLLQLKSNLDSTYFFVSGSIFYRLEQNNRAFLDSMTLDETY